LSIKEGQYGRVMWRALLFYKGLTMNNPDAPDYADEKVDKVVVVVPRANMFELHDKIQDLVAEYADKLENEGEFRVLLHPSKSWSGWSLCPLKESAR
jgi:hypothetical protein